MCFLYILQSENHGKYYVGSSNDPQRRLKFHNSTQKGFTARFKPWRIVYVKGFSSIKLARQAERKVKSWKSKGRITRLINGVIEL